MDAYQTVQSTRKQLRPLRIYLLYDDGFGHYARSEDPSISNDNHQDQSGETACHH